MPAPVNLEAMNQHTPTGSRVPMLRSINPATGEAVGEVAASTPEEVETAVARARRALPGWRSLAPAARAAALAAAGEEVAGAAGALADLVTAEMGKLRRSALAEAQSIADSLKTLHHLIPALEPEEHRDGKLVTQIVRDALGVVAVITPWNFPLSMPESMLSPALLAGNTVVWKPSELTPLSGQLLHEKLARTLPAGVVELVQGADDVGRVLVAGDVQMVAFVGSQAAGKSIMAEAAKSLKRLVLELGGKDPMVVLEDADLDRAADFAVNGSFRNAGQVCVSVERIYVHEAVADAFIERVLDRARRWRIGPGTSDEVDMGPMVSAAQRDHVLAQLEEARRRGASILHGGKPIDGPGWFLEPAVVIDVADDMALMQVETFGPVAAIQRVRSAEEAITRANATTFGLGATVWSSPERARLLAPSLEAGMVGINRSIGGVAGTPWVGAKQSGYGFIESAEGLRQFTQTRKISYEES